MSERTFAKDYPCSEDDCERQAEVFWPVVDPDIPAHPYCREHADKRHMDLMLKLYEAQGDR